jgi:hypothetical protein
MRAGLHFRECFLLAALSAVLLAASWSSTQDVAQGSRRPGEQGGAPRPQPQFVYIGEWGRRGAGPGDLSLPVAIASDSLGLIYIADAGSGFVHKFTREGHPLLAFDDPVMTSPVAVAVDSSGEIFAADGRSGRIFVFLPSGDRSREQRTAGAGRFRSPSALALDADGNLFVADTALSEVAEFNARGRLLRIVARSGSGPGRVRSPAALVTGTDSSLFVADEGNSRILKFSAGGEFLASWGQSGAAAPGAVDRTNGAPKNVVTKNPVSLAIDDHYLYCFDAAPPRLLVWTLAGTPLFAQDLQARIGLSAGSSDTRASIALAARDELDLLDPSSGRVLRFQLRF